MTLMRKCSGLLRDMQIKITLRYLFLPAIQKIFEITHSVGEAVDRQVGTLVLLVEWKSDST